ncbi:hypothetical protein V2I01_24800 [Micromonospora sp. BRA006-A]|nr:hypothetical protein [Micromonospora sp. BRA006-A]
MSAHPDRVPPDTPAVDVAARAGCPVLVGRTQPAPPGPLLVGFDGSPSSQAALGTPSTARSTAAPACSPSG